MIVLGLREGYAEMYVDEFAGTKCVELHVGCECAEICVRFTAEAARELARYLDRAADECDRINGVKKEAK